MSQPTMRDIHIDVPLTNFLIAYSQDQSMFMANKVASNIAVAKAKDYYWVYDKGPFFRDDMRRRAPSQNFARTGWTLDTASYETLQWSLEVPIADEIRANADNPIDMDRAAAELLGQQNLIRMERDMASVMFGTTAWTSSDSSATNWENSSGVPITAVGRAQRTVQGLTGMVPNALACGLIVHHALKLNAQIKERIMYTRPALPPDQEAVISAALGIDTYNYSQASYDTTAEATTDSPTMSRIVDDDAIVYVRTPGATIFSATACSLMYWPPGGGMGVMERYREEEIRSDIARVISQWTFEKVSADLGYGFFDIAD